MKVTISKPEDSIDVRKVSDYMTIIGVDMTKSINIVIRERQGGYSFRAINNLSRSSPFCERSSLEECIKDFIGSNNDREVHAFETHQEAFKFIAENL